MHIKAVSKGSKYLFVFGFILTLLVMGTKLFQDKAWFLAIFFYVSAALIFYTYSISKSTPAKYLLPGVLLLTLFHIYPAFYSGAVAFTNDSNGHQLSKEQAIAAIVQDSKVPIATEEPIKYQTLVEVGSKKVFVLFKYESENFWLTDGKTVNFVSPDPRSILVDGTVVKLGGFKVLSPEKTQAQIALLQNFVINLESGISLQPQDLESLEVSQPAFRYDEAKDELVSNLSGEIYAPNDNGQMVSKTGEVLYPGWKANVGWRNFSSIITDKEIRRPLLAVLVWTFANAFLLVFISFLMGLVLALIFNFPALRSKRFYRTIFIIPMAIPSVLSLLVWSGLFTTETGVIDRMFHISIPWLTHPWWARVAVLIVELWITFPYMFLITTGAIQAIPGEILEAAAIDGASPLKSFTQIKLPLVVRTVAPLLVASVAMALNNFGAIYLLTGGGPTFSNSNGNAGATDILISYTYKLAFNSQEGNNYGLASALSILNFLIVGLISIYGLKKMKTMEEIN